MREVKRTSFSPGPVRDEDVRIDLPNDLRVLMRDAPGIIYAMQGGEVRAAGAPGGPAAGRAAAQRARELAAAGSGRSWASYGTIAGLGVAVVAVLLAIWLRWGRRAATAGATAAFLFFPACSALAQVAPPRAPDRYCGIYSLMAAFDFIGTEFDEEEMLTPRYVGSWDGSSMEELALAAREHGLQATGLGGLSGNELRRLRAPLLLHTRGTPGLSRFNHWMVYLGESADGRPLIFDPASPEGLLRDCSFLLGRWHGTALAVGTSEVAPPVPTFGMYNWVLMTACLTCVLMARGAYARGKGRRWMTLGAIGAGGLFGLIFHVSSPQGLLRDGATIAARQARVAQLLPRTGLPELKGLVSGSSAVLVDARYASDYHLGSIGAAISIPFHVADEVRLQALTGVGSQEPIVVFCQSDTCDFADRLAGKLIGDGFRDVRVFREGFDGWAAHGGGEQ